RATADFTPACSGPHSFSLAQLGRGRLSLDGVLVLDGAAAPPPPGISFVGLGSAELTTTVDLDAGRPVRIVVEFTNAGASQFGGVRVGCRRPPVPDSIERAVTAAAHA